MTVVPEGRITYADVGPYSDETERAMGRVLESVREWSDMPIAVQLAHAGRKTIGACRAAVASTSFGQRTWSVIMNPHRVVRPIVLAAALVAASTAAAMAQKIPIVPRRRPAPTDPAPAVGPQSCHAGALRSAVNGAIIGFGVVSPVSVFLLVRSPGRNSDVVASGAVAFTGAATGAIVGLVRSDSRTECRQIVHAPEPNTPNGPQIDTTRSSPDVGDAGAGPVTPTGSLRPVRRQAVDLGPWAIVPAERPAASDDRRRGRE